MSRQPIRELSPGQQEHRRRRERINQQRRRARLAGKPPVTAETLVRASVRLAAPPPVWDLPAKPACTDADPGLFFGPEAEAPEDHGRRLKQARVLCDACPVRDECLDGARDRGERYGIWGGIDLENERALRAVQATRPAVAAAGRA